jgi:hypothetical protein
MCGPKPTARAGSRTTVSRQVSPMSRTDRGLDNRALGTSAGALGAGDALSHYSLSLAYVVSIGYSARSARRRERLWSLPFLTGCDEAP